MTTSTNEPTTQLISDTGQAVLDAIRATPYGAVEVFLHQHRIVQMVRNQKLKLDPEQAGRRPEGDTTPCPFPATRGEGKG